MRRSPAPLDTEKLATVEREIITELDRLESLDEITEDDLERFRRSLPIDPQLAEVVQLALPYPWSDLYEYVEASERQSAYWRVSPDRRQPRSTADRDHKQRFARAARTTRGIEGTVDRNGQEIPASAAVVADKVSQEGSKQISRSESGERALKRLRDLVGS